MIRIVLAVAALAAAPAAAELRIAGVGFAPADILDARAIPDPTGKAGLLITFTPAADKRLLAATTAAKGKIVTVSIDGRKLSEAMVVEPLAGPISVGASYTLAEAETLAKAISGKNPLPEELAD